jgi:hypothetical protein
MVMIYLKDLWILVNVDMILLILVKADIFLPVGKEIGLVVMEMIIWLLIQDFMLKHIVVKIIPEISYGNLIIKKEHHLNTMVVVVIKRDLLNYFVEVNLYQILLIGLNNKKKIKILIKEILILIGNVK